MGGIAENAYSAFGGNSDPEFYTKSSLDPYQQEIEKLLFGKLKGGLGEKGMSKVAKQLMSQLTANPTDQLNDLFERSIMQPSLRAFDRDIAPRIADSFATVGGGVFNSRQGNVTSQALGDVMSSAQSQLAGLVNVPLQQTLSRIQGLGSLQGIKQGQLNPSMQFLGIPTQDTVAGPSKQLGQAQAIGGLLDPTQWLGPDGALKALSK